MSVNFHDGDTHAYGVTVGSLILLVNVIMLTGYTFGCHAFRHVVGGASQDWTSTAMNRMKYELWKLSTKLNEQHKEWAHNYRIRVMFDEFYIYAWTDTYFEWQVVIIWGGL